MVNYLPGIGEEIGPALVNHPDVALIAFTGSRRSACTFKPQAGKTPSGQNHVKRVIAEMGGKNAIIVDDDADLDEAVHGVVASAFGYAGQKCSACSRAIVLESVYDAFLERLIEATRSLKVGPAEDPACTVGPVIDAEAQQRISADHRAGEGRSAPGLCGGDSARWPTKVFTSARTSSPTCRRRRRIAQEEIFGPVLAVLQARRSGRSAAQSPTAPTTP